MDFVICEHNRKKLKVAQNFGSTQPTVYLVVGNIVEYFFLTAKHDSLKVFLLILATV